MSNLRLAVAFHLRQVKVLGETKWVKIAKWACSTGEAPAKCTFVRSPAIDGRVLRGGLFLWFYRFSRIIYERSILSSFFGLLGARETMHGVSSR